MEFRFKSDTKPFDFWILSMIHTYRSIVGVCNIVFTVAVIFATCRLWGKINDVLELFLFAGCFLFTVIQPTLVYIRAKAQAAVIPKDMEWQFNDYGLKISVGEKTQTIPWKNLKGATIEPNMVVIRSDERHGYIITNRTMGTRREEFLQYLQKKIK